METYIPKTLCRMFMEHYCTRQNMATTLMPNGLTGETGEVWHTVKSGKVEE